MPPTTVTTLERLRLERGESRLQVTRGVPINRKTLKRLEQGIGEPRALTVQRLAHYYDVRVDWLLHEIRRDRFVASHGRAA
jgi:transcriptional regulator with XRE-family HTH domain